MEGAEGTEAFHCLGLEEKIWNVFAPSSAALRAERSNDPAMEVWIPMRTDLLMVDAGAPRRALLVPERVDRIHAAGVVGREPNGLKRGGTEQQRDGGEHEAGFVD